jgi:hypothetical protein
VLSPGSKAKAIRWADERQAGARACLFLELSFFAPARDRLTGLTREAFGAGRLRLRRNGQIQPTQDALSAHWMCDRLPANQL